jgi:cytochrome P450
MAGQHTSAATTSWILLHTAATPDVQYAFSRFLINFRLILSPDKLCMKNRRKSYGTNLPNPLIH